MNDILIRSTPAAGVVGAALAKAIDAQLRELPLDTTDDEFVRALADPAVEIGVQARTEDMWDVLARTKVPLIVVPSDRALESYALERVLVPMDGTDEAAAAVAEALQLFRTAGVEIVVLHVFDADTVPPFWDQAAHARAAWEYEFRARFAPGSGPGETLTLRNGAPADTILAVADDEFDLIVLGWSQRLEPGHCRIVRETVAAATVPVLLVPPAVAA